MTQNLPKLTKSSNIARTQLVKVPHRCQRLPQNCEKVPPKVPQSNEMKKNEPKLRKVSHR